MLNDQCLKEPSDFCFASQDVSIVHPDERRYSSGQSFNYEYLNSLLDGKFESFSHNKFFIKKNLLKLLIKK